MPDLTGQDGTRTMVGKQYKNRVYCADGRTLPYKYDGVAWTNMGIKKANYPDNIILTTVVTANASYSAAGTGQLNGLYVWVLVPVSNKYTTPLGFNIAGIPSYLSTPLTLNAQGADISGIPATHPDSQVTGWELYRNQAGAWQTGDDAGQDYKMVAYIPIGTTTFTDNVDDSLLVGQNSVRFNQNFPPAFNCIELYGERLFGAGFDPITTGTATLNTKTITNKALTSNLATITTSGVHGYVVGQIVTVATGSGDPIFDGAHYIVSTPLTTTFTFTKVNANVTSVAETGTTQVIDFAGVTLPTGVLGCWFQVTGDSNRYRIIGNYSVTEIAVDRSIGSPTAPALLANTYTIYRDSYQIYFSEYTDVEAWGNDSEGLRNYLEVPGRKNIRGLLTYFGSLLVFSNNDIFVISGQGADRASITMTPHAVYADVGVASQKSIATMKEQIWFLSRDGLYMMQGGGEPQLISYRILSDWLLKLNDADLSVACVGCQKNRYVYVSVPANSGDTENGKHYTYDSLLDKWEEETGKHPGGYYADDGDNGFPDMFYYQGASIFQPLQGSTDVTTTVLTGTVTTVNSTTQITDSAAAFPTTNGGVVEAYIEFFNSNNVSQGRRRISANTATTVSWSATAVGGGALAVTLGWSYRIGHIHWAWKSKTLEDPGHQARAIFLHIVFDSYASPATSHITITEFVDGVARSTQNYMPVDEQTKRFELDSRAHSYAVQVESWDGAAVREISLKAEPKEYT